MNLRIEQYRRSLWLRLRARALRWLRWSEGRISRRCELCGRKSRCVECIAFTASLGEHPVREGFYISEHGFALRNPGGQPIRPEDVPARGIIWDLRPGDQAVDSSIIWADGLRSKLPLLNFSRNYSRPFKIVG